MVFVAVSASVLVPFLFGDDKVEGALVTPALAVVVVVNVGWAVDQGLHLSRVGKPGRWFAYIAVSAGIALALLSLVVHFGLLIVVLAWVATSILESVARCFMVGSLIGIAPWRVLFRCSEITPHQLLLLWRPGWASCGSPQLCQPSSCWRSWS